MGLFSLFLFLFYCSSPIQVFCQGVVSLTFDDGYHSHYANVLPILERYKIKATFYLCPSSLDKEGYLSKEEVFFLVSQGHEIGSHAEFHEVLTNRSYGYIKNSLLSSKQQLEEITGRSVENFAPPFGAFPSYAIPCLQKCYLSSRSVLPGLNSLTAPFFIRGNVVFNTTTIDNIKELVDRAVLEDKWLVLIYHNIEEDGKQISISPAVLVEHLKLLQEKKIPILTVKEARKRVYFFTKDGAFLPQESAILGSAK